MGAACIDLVSTTIRMATAPNHAADFTATDFTAPSEVEEVSTAGAVGGANRSVERERLQSLPRHHEWMVCGNVSTEQEEIGNSGRVCRSGTGFPSA